MIYFNKALIFIIDTIWKPNHWSNKLTHSSSPKPKPPISHNHHPHNKNIKDNTKYFPCVVVNKNVLYAKRCAIIVVRNVIKIIVVYNISNPIIYFVHKNFMRNKLLKIWKD
jgi:hypothetical protein